MKSQSDFCIFSCIVRKIFSNKNIEIRKKDVEKINHINPLHNAYTALHKLFTYSIAKLPTN
jgi:hypothetical protein